MLQQLRRIFRRSPAFAGTVACAWLAAGVAPCFAAESVPEHDHHDCPHCETVLAATPSCDAPDDAICPSFETPGDPPPAVPAGYPAAFAGVRSATGFAPHGLPPPERSRLHRLCRLLE